MIIAFTKVKLPYGWMSNMAPSPIEYDGVTWRTAEHLFQALRFPASSMIREEIRGCPSPMGAKMVQKRYADQRSVEPWSEQDLVNMRLVLRLKFAQHPDLRDGLTATEDDEIIEDCTKRQNESGLFWGKGLVDGVWIGQNVLGTMLIELRAEYLAECTTECHADGHIGHRPNPSDTLDVKLDVDE